MPFTPFEDLFPELGQQETRVVALLGHDLAVPSGPYALVELYCNERNCDCRRVMLYVTSLETKRLEAVIAFGWASEAFYRSWYGEDDRDVIDALRGPTLNLGSPASEHADVLLDEVSQSVLSDKNYVERLKRHYEMFRKQINSPKSKPYRSRAKKTGRNDKCPCGSDRKFKACCGREATTG